MGKTKISKIEKVEDWVGWLSGRLRRSFEVIVLAKIDFEIFCSVLILPEGPTLDDSKTLLKHKKFWSNFTDLKNCSRQEWEKEKDTVKVFIVKHFDPSE